MGNMAWLLDGGLKTLSFHWALGRAAFQGVLETPDLKGFQPCKYLAWIVICFSHSVLKEFPVSLVAEWLAW